MYVIKPKTCFFYCAIKIIVRMSSINTLTKLCVTPFNIIHLIEVNYFISYVFNGILLEFYNFVYVFRTKSYA